VDVSRTHPTAGIAGASEILSTKITDLSGPGPEKRQIGQTTRRDHDLSQGERRV
jgi:hypothetical protein